MEVYSQSGGIYKSFYKAKLSHFTKKRGFLPNNKIREKEN